jgi:hypothetical protein
MIGGSIVGTHQVAYDEGQLAPGRLTWVVSSAGQGPRREDVGESLSVAGARLAFSGFWIGYL